MSITKRPVRLAIARTAQSATNVLLGAANVVALAFVAAACGMACGIAGQVLGVLTDAQAATMAGPFLWVYYSVLVM